MNPILKFCGYYCSCILVVGIIFFLILICLVEEENPYLLKDPNEKGERIEALTLAIICNAVCFGLCVACLFYGRMTEPKTKDDYDEV